MPERAGPFSLLLHLTEKWRQCLVGWASFYHSLAETVFLADLIGFQHKNFTAFFQVTKKELCLLQWGYLPYRYGAAG